MSQKCLLKGDVRKGEGEEQQVSQRRRVRLDAAASRPFSSLAGVLDPEQMKPCRGQGMGSSWLKGLLAD